MGKRYMPVGHDWPMHKKQKLKTTVWAERGQVPNKKKLRHIDSKLVVGSCYFGIGGG